MNIEIVHVVDKKFNLNYGFMFHLTTVEELERYMREVSEQRWSWGFADFAKCADANHASTPEGNLLQQITSMTGKPAATVMAELQLKVWEGMRKCLPIVVNEVGGYFKITDQEILERREVGTWTLPEKNRLKVSQWPNGKHWYAKLGSQEVVMWGARKWDSKEEAVRVAKKFAEENNIQIEGEI